jgi:PAS domain S-box-containing protein
VTPLGQDLDGGRSAPEGQYAALIENAPDAIVSSDQDGLITGFNPAAERIFGYPSDEVLGKPLTILMPERLQDAHLRGFARFLATGEARIIGSPAELIGRRKDGVEIPVELSLSSWEAEGRTNFTAFLRDITDRRLMEDVNRQLAGVVEQSEDAILRKSSKGIVTGWNAGAERLYGYSAEEMIGQPVQVLIPEERNGEEREILDKVFGGEAIAQYETARVRKDGTAIDVAVTISPLRDRAGEIIGASAIGRDITERKRAERELHRSNADLERFAYVASHDLSEPLRVIAGFVDLLARRYKGQLDEEADRFIAFTISGVERMQALIDDLLAYSKVGRAELKRADVDTAELVEGVLADLDGLVAERGARVEVAELPTVWGEPVLLRQVLQNLIGNAVKFGDGEAPRVWVSATRRGARWRIDVEDNGSGIDPGQRERIFEMFQRLHGRDTPGTGIGLAIAKLIVERHDGRIWVDSASDGGSIFSFTIAEGRGTAA